MTQVNTRERIMTSREAKLKAQQAIDSMCSRFGDLLQAGIVYAGVSLAFTTIRDFALICEALVVVWIFVAMAIGREHRQRVAVAAQAAPALAA